MLSLKKDKIQAAEMDLFAQRSNTLRAVELIRNEKNETQQRL